MPAFFTKLKENYHLPVIFAASVLLLLPMIIFGFPFGTLDLIHHAQLSLAYFDSIKEGVLFPVWRADENFGYGSVAVRFYPPLTPFVMALFCLLCGSWGTAFIASFFFWSLVGGFGTYLFASDIFKSRRQATIASVVFILAHYRVNELYNAFMFSEFVALSIFPFAFYFTKKICERGRLSDILGFAASIALLILSNLPQTVIAAVSLGIFVLFQLKKEDFFKQTAKLAAGCLLGLLCSSFYWIRLLGERHWLNVYQPNTDPDYDFRNNFLLTSLELDDRGTWLVSSMFVALAIFIILTFAVTKSYKTILHDRTLKGLSAVFITGMFLMIPFSSFVWENLAFLQRLQFPWRFLAVASMCAACLVGHCFGFITRENLRAKRPLAIILVGVTFIYCFISVRQVALGGRVVDAAQFSALFEESRRAEGLPHWWTTWMKKEAFEQTSQVSANERTVEIQIWDNEHRRFSVAEGEKTQARIACFYYPHWQATINGKPAEVLRSPDGAILIDLPTEKSVVELTFNEPETNLLAGKLSFVAWTGLLIAAFYGWFRRKKINL